MVWVWGRNFSSLFFLFFLAFPGKTYPSKHDKLEAKPVFLAKNLSEYLSHRDLEMGQKDRVDKIRLYFELVRNGDGISLFPFIQPVWKNNPEPILTKELRQIQISGEASRIIVHPKFIEIKPSGQSIVHLSVQFQNRNFILSFRKNAIWGKWLLSDYFFQFFWFNSIFLAHLLGLYFSALNPP